VDDELAGTQQEFRLALLKVIEDFGLGEGESGYVKGAALMVEWMGEDGRRWLTHTGLDPHGDEIPEWQVQGYYHNFLQTPWPEAEEDD
jgi:hypothetical protein